MTETELHVALRKNAIWAIRRWEETVAKSDPSPAKCPAAELEVYRALWSFPGNSIIVDGRRYRALCGSESSSPTTRLLDNMTELPSSAVPRTWNDVMPDDRSVIFQSAKRFCSSGP
jgi:hypothetical protein